MRAALGLNLTILVLVGACATQSASGTSSATPSPISTQLAPSSPANAQLTCSLPFVSSDNPSAPYSPYGMPNGQLGFVRFPGGSFSADPSAGFVSEPTGLRSVAQPTLRGDFNGINFDRLAGRWLPVAEANVSPDGRRYVYAQPPMRQALILVDVATGGETVLYREPSPTGLVTLGFKSDGIYIEVPAGMKLPSGGAEFAPPDRPGLYLVDPSTGAERRLFAGSVDGIVAGGAIWTSSPDGVTRTDIGSGSRETWFAEAGHYVEFLALDQSGAAIVEAYGGPGLAQEMWRVGAAGAGHKFYSQAYAGYPPLHREVEVDSHGVWFGSAPAAPHPGALYLYSADRFIKVAYISGWPLSECG